MTDKMMEDSVTDEELSVFLKCLDQISERLEMK